jgi:amidase
MSIREETENMDAVAQAELVKRGELKPVELVEAAFERIRIWNPRINAVVTEMFEEALREAEGPIPDGPFKGVPFLVKDLLASCAGVPLTMGSKLMKDFVPKEDSELIRRIRRAGLIILGKTNTPELGILPTTEPKLFGPCRNPWSLDRTPGGSAGGPLLRWQPGWFPWRTETMEEDP